MSRLGQAMGTQRPRKRNFFYPTIDPRCVPPLLAHVPPGTVFAEPCAGAGDLIQLLEAAGLVCAWGLELEPQGDCLANRWPIGVGDAMGLTARDLGAATVLISNLPWERSWLHPLIRHLAAIAPLWSLHDASWAYTQQAAPFRRLLTDVAAVGRLKWFAGSKYDPPDDCAWYRFDAAKPDPDAPVRFHLPTPRGEAAQAGQLALL
jgi:hypothetical protein